MAGQKETIELEYILNTTPGLLFNRISTASGLSEWFADEVNIDGKVFVLRWEGSEQRVEQTVRKENKLVRYTWVDDEELEGEWFEFRINVDELTGDVALIVIDNVDVDEKDDLIEIWNRQIDTLKRCLGSI
ncbi:MAG TPA: SRPBCC domain-containing protein [Bacteroidales bacterium]|jgi:uncharacterized protein YndB with AHSA1/START domain|nr:SRPBCC domain-containing protein [Bacteroidales bacterium]